jgi:hypothetical protein
MMVAGAEFETTQGSIDFIGLIAQAMFTGGDKKSDGSTPPAPQPSTPAPAPANP